MRIGMVLDQPFPPDIRVEKETASLARAGHEVHLLSVGFRKEQSNSKHDELSVHRIRLPEQPLKKLRALARTVPFYHWLFAKHIKSFATRFQIDVLHVHDLPLVRAAIAARRTLRIPVVADFHEDYPELLRHSRHTQTPLGRLLIHIARWKAEERWAVEYADRVIVVSPEMHERLRLMGTPVGKIFILPNTVSIEHLYRQPIDETVAQRFRDRYVLVYVGGFDSLRGLETLIDAAHMLRDPIPNLAVLLIGTGTLEAELRKRAEPSRNVVHFEGWQPYGALRSYLELANVCVIPHRKSVHTDNTDPNKLYEYLAFAKPVVVSNCAALEKRVKEMQCGLVFTSDNARELAECVLRLYRDPQQAKRFGENGYCAVQDRYNWEVTVTPLLDLYASIQRRR